MCLKMRPFGIFPILALLLFYLICYGSPVDGKVNKSAFEGAFAATSGMLEFHSFPHYGALFKKTVDIDVSNLTTGEEVEQVTKYVSLLGKPYLCVVPLLRPGVGRIVEMCASTLRKHQKKEPKLRDIVLAYRCLKSDNPYDYELMTVPIDAIAPPSTDADSNEFTFVELFFTPPASHSSSAKCEMKTIFSEKNDAFVEKSIAYMKGKGGLKSVEKVNPLSKAKYEAAFTHAPTHHWTDPQQTFLFEVFSLPEAALRPLKKCPLRLVQYGKGEVDVSCARTINLYYKIDPTLPNLLIPYRCYRHDSPDDYVLLNSTIDDIEFHLEQNDDNTGAYLYFTPQETTHHCKVTWTDRFLPAMTFLSKESDYLLFDMDNLGEAEELSRGEYEASFLLKDNFNQAPYTTWIFTRLPPSPKWTSIRECLIVFQTQPNQVQTSTACGEIVNAFYSINQSLPSLIVPYRCFKNADKPGEGYLLKMASISRVKRVNSKVYHLELNLPQTDDCTAIWSSEYLLKNPPQPDPSMVKQITRQVFLKTFERLPDGPSIPYHTFLFLKAADGSYMPIGNCLVSLHSYGKATLKEIDGDMKEGSCNEDIALSLRQQKGNSVALILPYRCYLGELEDEEYELLETRVQGVKVESGQMYLVFKMTEKDYCDPIWQIEFEHNREGTEEDVVTKWHDEL